jgi:hypothetical protein
MTLSVADSNRRGLPEKAPTAPYAPEKSPVQNAQAELLSKSIPYRIRANTLHDPQKAPEDLLATVTYLKRTYPKIHLAYCKTMGLGSDTTFIDHLIEELKKGTCYGQASSLMKQARYDSLLVPLDNMHVFYYQFAQTLQTTLDDPDYLRDILVTHPLVLTANKLQQKVYEAQKDLHFDFPAYKQAKLQKCARKLKELSTLPKAERDEEKRLRLIFKSGLLVELNPDTLFEDPSEALQKQCFELFDRELQKEMKKFHKDLPIDALHPSPRFSSHATVGTYEQQFKDTAAHFPEGQELSGCVNVPGHVFSFQYSPETGHFYIDNWGVFQYPDEKSFFEGLKTQVERSLCNHNIHEGNENDPREEAPYEISFAMAPS